MRDKTINALIKILVVACIIFVCLSAYEKFLKIRQSAYDLRYKETINSSIEYPYNYIYRRYDRETGEIIIVANGLNDQGDWAKSNDELK